MAVVGQPVGTGGDEVFTTGHWVLVGGHRVAAGGQLVAVVGQLVAVRGHAVDWGGHCVSTDGHCVDAAGQNVLLAGQMVAWRSLAAQGVFLPSNPHAAFFYMLSAVHGLHVVGGLGALTWTLRRAAGGAYTASNHDGLTHAAIFWHFMGGVWIYLLALLSTL